jgi:hypothetical protein
MQGLPRVLPLAKSSFDGWATMRIENKRNDDVRVRGRPSKAATLKLFAAFANDRNRIDGPANPTANLGQVGQDAVQIGLGRSQLSGKQLVGERIRRHAATPGLPLKTVVSVWGDMDYPVSRCHE